jgi:hypothetical protein
VARLMTSGMVTMCEDKPIVLIGANGQPAAKSAGLLREVSDAVHRPNVGGLVPEIGTSLRYGRAPWETRGVVTNITKLRLSAIPCKSESWAVIQPLTSNVASGEKLKSPRHKQPSFLVLHGSF